MLTSSVKPRQACLVPLIAAVIFLLLGCQPATVQPTPDVTLEILPPQTETPVPACVSLPGVELTVEQLSDNSVEFNIKGLKQDEPIYILFASEVKNKGSQSLGWGEKADEHGNYESRVQLRNPLDALDFKDWQIRVIHSRGATCAEFSLP